MIGVGLVFEVVLDRRLDYQPGWWSLPLAAAELAAIMGIVYALGISAPLFVALAFFAGSWSLNLILMHAVFPYLRLSYGDEGAELGCAGVAIAILVLASLALFAGVALAMQPPTVRLSSGIHGGPLVLDRAQNLVGEPGAVVRGGIIVTADNYHDQKRHRRGRRERDRDRRRAQRHARRREDLRSAARRSPRTPVFRFDQKLPIHSPAGDYAQGIDISFGFDLAASSVEDCTVIGGREGIVTHFAHVRVADNRVTGTSLRALDADRDVDGGGGGKRRSRFARRRHFLRRLFRMRDR